MAYIWIVEVNKNGKWLPLEQYREMGLTNREEGRQQVREWKEDDPDCPRLYNYRLQKYVPAPANRPIGNTS